MANLYDRVQESTTTTGTGTYTLGGAVTGFRTFNSQAANGTVIRCVIEDGVGGYEVGDYTLGTNTLARTTIIESSNSNNAVNWGSGTKYIYSDATARDVLPDQTSNSGKFLITDGTNPAWSNTVSSLTLSAGTANGVLYLNGSKAATSGSSLTFDGANLHVPGGGGIATNEAFGTGALKSNTTGANNTASGYNALFSNTTGANNTASGYAALYSNTTGVNNTASGQAALFSNTTGNYNTASGAYALYSNTTGNYNTASGLNALFANTTGNYNTASGLNALFANTTGYQNTASGYAALFANTTGYQNTASGVNALVSNTTGAANTADGFQALYSNTTGSGSTASGFQALLSNTTGSANTASGANALYSNTTGNYNTASGYAALLHNTTGSGNTAINPLNSAGTYAPVFDPTTENDRFCMGSTGVTNAYIQVAWTVVSDARDKTDFAPVPHGLDFVIKLKPTAYRYKIDRDATDGHGPVRYGLLAQDVLALEGDNPVVVDAEDPDKLRFNDQSLIAVLVNAIQDLSAKVDAQAAEIAILKGN